MASHNEPDREYAAALTGIQIPEVDEVDDPPFSLDSARGAVDLQG
ncbi:hypothetical protein [Sphingomicrobium flavum]|nr:hypothetical protein [Sphingomicrobium flavum]